MQKTQDKPTAEDVLKEFVADIEAVGQEHVQMEWPDLLETYKKAVTVLSTKTKEK